MLPHHYKFLLLYVKNYSSISARAIQNEALSLFDISKGYATLLAAHFITEAYQNGDITIDPNTAYIAFKEREVVVVPTLPEIQTGIEQAEPANN